jgi:hypothetical protein
MAAPSRTAQFTRLHKILKKHYTPTLPDPGRSLLENLLFASCLENAHAAAAEEAFAALVHNFFDLNEVRVSSVRELAEVMASLPDPQAAATRVKRVLQSVFEATYSFDLEGLKKMNQGPAVEKLEKIDGATKFSVAYVIQASLGGHSIALDSGTLGAMYVADVATEEETTAGVVAGLERAIPKSSGAEFASLLHQLGADFTAHPYNPALHAILLEINPEAKSRLPSRRAAKKAEAPPAEEREKTKKAAAKAPAEEKSPADGKKKGTGKKSGEPAEATAAAPKKEKHAAEKEAAKSPPAEKEKSKEKRTEKEKRAEPRKEEAARKPAATKKPASDKKHPETAKGKHAGEKMSASEGLSKRKPR